MKPFHATVPIAALAAALTRWPSPLWGALATLLAVAWTLCAYLAPQRPRLHVAGPAAALALTALPTSPDALLPLPGIVVGLAVGLALLTALPERHDGVRARTGAGAWLPTLLVAALLAIPLLVPAVLGPDRLSAMADRTSPTLLAVATALLALAALGYVLVTRKEATA